MKHWEPPFACRLVTPDSNRTFEAAAEIIRKWCPKDQLKGGRWDTAYQKQRGLLRMENGSFFEFMSAEQDLDKFGGSARHRIHYDEEPPKQIRQECQMRLVDYGGGEVFSMTPLRGMCVDTETECLTKRGWKRHDDLVESDVLLTYNVAEGQTEWAALKGVYRNPAYGGPMVRTPVGSQVDAVFTPDHRWVTEDGLRSFEGMTKTTRVRVAAPHLNMNAEVYEPELLELAGWVLSDGSVVKDENKVVIYQSFTAYPENCAHIEDLLKKVEAQFYVGTRSYKQGIGKRFQITGDRARQLRFLIGYPKRLRPELVSSLDPSEANALLCGLLDGDGSRRENGSWDYTSKDRELADAVSIVALLCGWRISVRGYDNDTTWIVHGFNKNRRGGDWSRQVSAAQPCEPPTDGIWCPSTRNKSFVARRNGSVYITGNTWVYDEVYEQRHTPEVDAFTVDMDDNPFLNEEAKKRLLAGLSKEELQARKSGRFVHFAGLVYPEMNDKLLVPRPSPDHIKGQNVVVGIDPGVRFTAVVWTAFDNDNAALVFEELLETDSTIYEVCEKILKRNAEWGVTPDYYVIDPSARNRGQINAETVMAEFSRFGIYTVPGQNDLEAGVLITKRRLQDQTLHFSRSLGYLLHEFDRYRIDANSQARFAVIKKNDHCLDALRYALMSRAWDLNMPKRTNAQRARFSAPLEEVPPMGVWS
jgi:phage terminase large subunit-like protein